MHLLIWSFFKSLACIFLLVSICVNKQSTIYTSLAVPALGIKIRGPLDDTKISYDFEDLKQKLFNEGVKKILKTKKSIIVDPDTIKQFFGDELKKEFNPKKIIDLFSN